MKRYVSFGQQYNLRNCMMEFEGLTDEEVAAYMRDNYQNRYAFIYPEESAKEQIEFFGLTVVFPGESLKLRG